MPSCFYFVPFSLYLFILHYVLIPAKKKCIRNEYRISSVDMVLPRVLAIISMLMTYDYVNINVVCLSVRSSWNGSFKTLIEAGLTWYVCVYIVKRIWVRYNFAQYQHFSIKEHEQNNRNYRALDVHAQNTVNIKS